MRWTPYTQFRTGYSEGDWTSLTPAEQKQAYRASGKQRKAANPEVVEEGGEEYLIVRTFAFPVRLVLEEELLSMPVFQMF